MDLGELGHVRRVRAPRRRRGPAAIRASAVLPTLVGVSGNATRFIGPAHFAAPGPRRRSRGLPGPHRDRHLDRRPSARARAPFSHAFGRVGERRAETTSSLLPRAGRQPAPWQPAWASASGDAVQVAQQLPGAGRRLPLIAQGPRRGRSRSTPPRLRPRSGASPSVACGVGAWPCGHHCTAIAPWPAARADGRSDAAFHRERGERAKGAMRGRHQRRTARATRTAPACAGMDPGAALAPRGGCPTPRAAAPRRAAGGPRERAGASSSTPSNACCHFGFEEGALPKPAR